jgi:deaminated glutathione amidase
MKVASIQMISSPIVADNLAAAKAHIQEAAAHGAELVVLPEYFCAMSHCDSDKFQIAETENDGPIQEFLAEIACREKIWLVAGTIPLKSHDPKHLFNSTLVYKPDGSCVARYNKIHLFRFNNGIESYDESDTLLAGSTPVFFDLASNDGHIWRIGLSVCYDLRFPELYREQSKQGAHLLLIPAAFTYTTGQDHWEILLRARAIENLVFVGAAAQGGQHVNGRKTWGQTMWIDPWGHILSEKAQGESAVFADIDYKKMITIRTQLPALNHRLL